MTLLHVGNCDWPFATVSWHYTDSMVNRLTIVNWWGFLQLHQEHLILIAPNCACRPTVISKWFPCLLPYCPSMFEIDSGSWSIVIMCVLPKIRGGDHSILQHKPVFLVYGPCDPVREWLVNEWISSCGWINLLNYCRPLRHFGGYLKQQWLITQLT